METEQKMERLKRLLDDWDSCERCGLCTPTGRRRHHVVFGEGSPDAHIVVIGDAPREKEDITGRPFAGRQGEVLDMFLNDNNSTRDDVFLLNIVGCRPTDEVITGKPRAPSRAELTACSPRVAAILDIVDPYVVILLGGTAFKTLALEKGGIKAVASDSQIPDVRAVTQGTCVRQSMRTWEKAFRVSDMCAELYRGITPPLRSNDD